MDLAPVPRPGARSRAGPGGPRLPARRSALRHRRQPAAPRTGPRWPAQCLGGMLGARLPGLDRQGAGLRLEPRRGERRSWPRTRSRSTRSLALRDELPALRLVVYDDPRGDDRLPARLAQVLRGRAGGGSRSSAPSTRATSRPRSSKGRADDVAVVSLHLRHHRQSQGRDDHPRQRHRRGGELPAGVASRARRIPRSRTCRWPGRGTRSTRSSPSLVAGFCANCPESPETVQRDLRELGPSTLLAPPRIWENMLTAVQVRAADATPLKRRTFDYFRAAAERAEILRTDGKPRAGRAAAGHRARRVLRLRPGARSAGPSTDEVGADRRRAPRPRHLPLLPLDRRQPQAGLRLHRDDRARLAAARPARRIPPPPGGRCRASRSRSPTAARCW